MTDFTGVARPISASTPTTATLDSTADVDVSVDGGATWTNVWDQTARLPRPGARRRPAAAWRPNKSAVQVRFHYTGTWAWWWEVDNVFLGSRTCDPVPGGLVAGTVTDANTDAGVVGATVTSVDDAGRVTATTAATPDDPNLGDGFYWMFSSLTGKHPFTAAKKQLRVEDEGGQRGGELRPRRRRSTSPPAGSRSRRPASRRRSPWQGTASQVVTVKNTGGAPANVTLGEQPGGIDPADRARRTGQPGQGQVLAAVPARQERHRDDGDRRQAGRRHAGRRAVDRRSPTTR